jgi:signal transduction histidine kinase
MGSFGWGLATGLVGGLAGASLLAVSLYRRLLRSERRARQAERLAELGTLTGGLAHEIKNPLSTVQLNLQLLQEDLSPDDPAFGRVVNRLNLVHRETSRLRDILDDFLRYAGKLELDRRPTDLNQVVEELVDFFTPQAQVNRVQARWRAAPEPVMANVDAKLIKQAVLNLMLNAVQAMAERKGERDGGGGGELILSASRADGEAIIDVIDTGPGISPDALARIFDAYYSTKRGGTGLGLAMARRIVEEHEGRITVSSEVGKGTDFRVHLPVGAEMPKSETRSPNQ